MDLLCVWVEQFIVVAHTHRNPTTEEWNRVLEAISSQEKPVLGALISTEGGSPSSFQRKQLRDALHRQKSEAQRSAVLTNSALARIAIVALNLFLKTRVEAFPPDAVQDALRYIEAPPALWVPLTQALTALKSQLRDSRASIVR